MLIEHGTGRLWVLSGVQRFGRLSVVVQWRGVLGEVEGLVGGGGEEVVFECGVGGHGGEGPAAGLEDGFDAGTGESDVGGGYVEVASDRLDVG